MKVAALEQLLRTVAERAQHMTTQEILALNDTFKSSSSSSTAPARAAAMGIRAPARNGLAGFQADAAALLEPLMQFVQQQQSPGHAYGGAGSYGSSQFGGVAPVGSGGSGDGPQAGPLPTIEEVGGGLNTVKVSSRANVKSIAGALAKSLRNNDMLVATAVGGDGLNHGMKALSIARTYLAADGLDLSATVVEVQPDTAMNSPGQCYAFVVVRIVVPAKVGEPLCEAGVGRTEPLPRFVRPPEQQTDMKVSGQNNPATLGGAIAKCLREDREIIITAVGPASVAKCVEAMALARSYVWNDGLQLAFYPGFEHIIMQGVGPGAGEQRSCVRVHVWPEVAQGDGQQHPSQQYQEPQQGLHGLV
mmetsp:Transcript_104832/g.338035  ORF Transcript_104832/g.338035 Transcript_104832/m.338035 type:complete len:361 (-) Transcript_104832:250-1332(-)